MPGLADDALVQPQRTAIVIVGMHRSGTSAIARTLNLLGADLPKKIMPARPNNVTGFWESLELVKLHNEMLHAAGSSWDDIDSLPPFWEDRSFILPYYARIAETIKGEYAGSTLPVIKDPRISRWIPLMARVLREEVGVEPKFIIAIRNPLEVAASLKQRNGFSLSKSLLLWLDHTLSSERWTRGSYRSFIFYDELLENWRSTIGSALEDMELMFPRSSQASDNEVEAFLKAGLRHHVYTERAIHDRKDVPEWIKEAFGALKILRSGAAGAYTTLDRVRSEVEIARVAFGPLLEAQLAKDIGRLNHKVGQLASICSSLEVQARTQESKAGKLSAELELRTEKHARQIQHLTEKHARQIQHLSRPNWISRNLRRGVLLVLWLCSGQFRRAADAALPFYRRFTPAVIRRRIPAALRGPLIRRLKAKATKATGKKASTSKATTEAALAETATADAASNMHNWPRAARHWRNVLEDGSMPMKNSIRQGLINSFKVLLDTQHYSAASELLRLIPRSHRQNRWALALDGILLLRTCQFKVARKLWANYWESALSNPSFADEALPNFIPSESTSQPFVTTQFCGNKFAYGKSDARFCVYTALFGDYDELTPPMHQPPDVDFICFSDKARDVPGWNHQLVDPEASSLAMKNRRLKILPYDYLANYDHSLYIDSSVIFTGDPILLFHHWLQDKPFVAWRHPERQDVYEECEAILAQLKSEPSAVISEIEYFEKNGVPRHSGLIEATFLWRDHRDGDVRKLMHCWWDHVSRYGGRDQPGLAFWTWKLGIQPEVLPSELGTSRGNNFYAKRHHKTSLVKLERLRTSSNNPPQQMQDSSPTRKRRVRRRLTWVYRTQAVQTATIMRGEQLFSIVKNNIDEGVDVSYLSELELEHAKDSALFLTRSYLKDATSDELAALRDSGNILCADYVDHEERAELHDLIDVYIAASIQQFLYLIKRYPEKLVHHITHNTDPAIRGIRGPTKYCNIGYFGEMVNARYAAQLQGLIDFVQTNNSKYKYKDWVQRLRHCNVHYSVRQPRPADRFKPFTKGFTAARCYSNIIVPLAEGDARYYLGAEYPYILSDDSLESVLDMIDRVKTSFGSLEWRHGTEIMASVRERSSDQHVVNEVKSLLRRL